MRKTEPQQFKRKLLLFMVFTFTLVVNDFPVFAGLDSDLYVTNRTGELVKISPNGSITTLFSGLGTLDGLSFDSEGYLYISQETEGRILKFNKDITDYKAFVANAGTPKLINFNSRDELFVADTRSVRILKVPHNKNPMTIAQFQGSGITGITIDKKDNLYLSVHFTGQIYKLENDPGSPTGFKNATIFATISQSRIDISGMHFGPDGNLYVASFSEGALYRVSPSGNVSLVTNNLTRPDGVSIEPDGDIFVAEVNPGGCIKEIPLSEGISNPRVLICGLPYPDDLAPLSGLGSQLNSRSLDIGVGFQFTGSVQGVSLRLRINDSLRLESDLWAKGSILFSLRLIYQFFSFSFANVYVAGGGTVPSGEDEKFHWAIQTVVGSEFLVDPLPPFLPNIEFGLELVAKDSGYFSSVGLGMGIHYYF